MLRERLAKEVATTTLVEGLSIVAAAFGHE
jgi:hypothetical protein